MRVAEFATATHAGRVRRKNEDAYFAEPPLFAVADGDRITLGNSRLTFERRTT